MQTRVLKFLLVNSYRVWIYLILQNYTTVEIDLKEAAEKAERDKQAAVEDEKERVENERLEKEEAQRAKAANLEHRKIINRLAIKAFKAHGYEEEKAVGILKLIVNNRIPNVTINY